MRAAPVNGRRDSANIDRYARSVEDHRQDAGVAGDPPCRGRRQQRAGVQLADRDITQQGVVVDRDGYLGGLTAVGR